MADIKALKQRLERLKSLRLPHEGVWRDCFDHSFPIRGSGLQSADLTAQTALDRKARLVDDTATDSARTLAAALVSGMTPASATWFAVEVMGADGAGAAWLDEQGQRLHKEIHSSGFDAAAYECSLDIVAAGWCALYIDTGPQGFRFEQWPIAGVYAAASRLSGKVDTVFRCYTLTAGQCVAEFGDRVSMQTAKAAAVDPETPVELCHAIYQRTAYMVGAKMARNLPIASCHFEVASHHALRESGYHEMPVIVPRWVVIPGSVYAVGPMFDALPSARQLNEMVRMDMAACEMAIAGMWIAEDDGVLNPRTIKVGARKVIVANSVDSMKELKSGGNWQLATDRIEGMRAQIRKLLMADQLQPQDGPSMTATEVHVRVSMVRQLLGPIYGRLQAEYLQPLVERCFALAFRGGLFDEPPESLAGMPFNVRFMSPLARAQRMEDVGAIERLNQNLLTLVNLGAAGVQAAMAASDVVNFDENVRTLIDGLGVPLKNANTAEQVAKGRQARAEAQQAAQQQQQAQELQAMAADTAMKRSIKAA
ncbi:MAG: portal protein [Caldilineaceae bacterium]